MTDAAAKRSRDQFFVILAGIAGYSLILIAIVIGTFFAVKNAFERKDAEVAKAVEGAGPVEEAIAMEEEAPPQEEPAEEVHEDVGQDETIYEETDSLKIAKAFRKAGRSLKSE